MKYDQKKFLAHREWKQTLLQRLYMLRLEAVESRVFWSRSCEFAKTKRPGLVLSLRDVTYGHLSTTAIIWQFYFSLLLLPFQ